MQHKKKLPIEGIIIIAIGVFFTFLAIRVPSNPVRLEGWLNVLAQAKAVPLLSGILMIAFGIVLTTQMSSGRVSSTFIKIKDKKGAIISLASTLIYLVSIIYFGFKITTALYLAFILIYLNKNKSKMPVIIASIISLYLVSIVLIPKILSLRLP